MLPFKNLTEDKSNEYFSDGITDDIITQLSKIGDLKVISRTSAMRYKNSDKSVRDIAGELGVATILEGTVRRASNQVRISSRLIDANTDEHLWAEVYDREMKDIFEIQSDVAHRVATALKAKFSSAEKERFGKKPTAATKRLGLPKCRRVGTAKPLKQIARRSSSIPTMNLLYRISALQT